MASDSSRPSIARALLLAAVVTLLVTLLRLWGEHENWNPRFFGKDAGGGFGIVGIAWLVPVFGFWFGRRLAQNGHRPAAVGKALLLPVLGFAACVGAGFGIFNLDADVRLRVWLASGAMAVLGLFAFAAWRRAWFVLVCYGLLARIPVIVVTWLSVERGWDNHYAKLDDTVPAEAKLLVLTLPQLSFWPLAFTPLVGTLFATLGSLTVRKPA